MDRVKVVPTWQENHGSKASSQTGVHTRNPGGFNKLRVPSCHSGLLVSLVKSEA